MANDPNQSNKKPANTLSDSDFSDIENIGRRAARHTAEDIAQRVRVSEAKRIVSIYEAGLQASPNEEVAKLIGRQLAAERKTINSLEPRITLRAETQRQRFTNLTQSVIERNFQSSSVNGQAAEFGRSSVGQRLGLGMMNTPFEELEANRLATVNQIGALGQKATGIAENLYNEQGRQDVEKLAQLQQIYAQRNRLVNKVGGIEVAQRQQRALGMDPQSRMDDLFSAGQRAEKVLLREGIANEMKSGQGELGAKSVAELKQREVQLSQQLVDALEKLKDTAGRSAEEIDKMRESAGKTAEDLEKVKEAITSGGGRYSDSANKLNFASSLFGAAGNTVQQIAVNQRLGQVANISGYAAIENQKYQTYKAASSGDVASQLAMSQFGGAESFGEELKVGTYTAQGLNAVGAGLQTASGKVRLLEATAQKLNPLAYASGASTQNTSAGLQAASDVAQGLSQTAIMGSNIFRGVDANQAAIQGFHAQMEARRQLSAVTAEQAQGLRDFGVGMSTAAIGMGSKGAGFLSRISDAGRGDEALLRARHGEPNISMLSRMADARISPEQMAQMAQIGVQQMGSTFNENQIFAARGLERSGFGSMQENMGRMASLAAAGSNNPESSLASVLEGAVSKGMDSSKAISMLTDNTAAMAKQSFAGAAGLDVTGTAATILGANIDPKSGNQEYATERAMTAQQVARDITTNTDISFSGMVNTSRISKKTGLGGDDAIFAAKLSTEELKALQGKSDEEIKSYMLQKGVNPNNANLQPKELVNTLLDASRETLMEAKGAGFAFGSDKLRGSLVEKSKANTPYEKLSDEEKALLGKMGGGNVTGKEFYGTSLGIGAQNDPNAANTVKELKAGEGGSDLQKMLEDMRTQGVKQLSQAASEATANFKTAADALKALGALAKNIENRGDQGEEGKSKIAAADAAGTFGKSTMLFEKSVGKFQGVIDDLMKKSGISNPNSQYPLLDNLNKNATSRQSAPGKE